MRTFRAIKKTPDSNTIVVELNARVYLSTFKDLETPQLADLYTYDGTVCNNPCEIVAHKSCAPALGIFLETIKLEF